MPVLWRRVATTTAPILDRDTQVPADDSEPAAHRLSKPFRSGRFLLRPDERWAIVGKTGSGKSVFARWIDAQYYRAGWPIVIIDPKKRYVDTSVGETYASTPSEATIARPFRNDGTLVEGCRVQIYLPTFPAIRDTTLDKLLFSVLEHGGMVLHIEDLSQMATESKWPLGFSANLQDGRAADIVMLNLAQQPVGIPTAIAKNTENFAFFRLVSPVDRARAAAYIGDERLTQGRPIPQRYFWYYREGADRATLMSPLTSEQVRQQGGLRPQLDERQTA
jgi:hypothetical protein